MLKIAMFGPYPVDERYISGGVEKVGHTLVQGLRRRDDIELHIVALADVTEPKTTASGNFSIHYVPRQRRFGLPTFNALSVRRARRAIQRIAPDLVHCQEGGIEGFVASTLPFPFVVTVHAVFHNERKHYPGLKARLRYDQIALLNRIAHPRVASFIPISQYVLNEIPAAAARSYGVIENPIEDRWFAVPDGEVPGRVLFSGTMYPRKGVVDLVRAVARVRDGGQPVSLHVTGGVHSPDYFAEVKSLVSACGLESSVSFLGLVSEDTLAREFSEAAVVALPSYAETSPMFIGQAMAAGKAVVSTRVGGIPWLVEDGMTGRLVSPGDVPALAAALGGILGDDERRRKMGREGQRRARARFGVDEVAAKTVEVYRKVLADRDGASS